MAATSSQLSAAYNQGENNILKQQNSFLQSMQMGQQHGHRPFGFGSPFNSSFMGSFMGNCCASMMNGFRSMGFGMGMGMGMGGFGGFGRFGW